MAIAKSPSASIKSPPIAVCDAIVRRFLKPDQNINWRREMPSFHTLWKLYPSLPFWQNYELPFGNGKLNMMTWFMSMEGKAELERAWTLFHYNPPGLTDPEPSLDNAPQGGQDGGVSTVTTEDAPQFIAPPRRARTVAELMKS